MNTRHRIIVARYKGNTTVEAHVHQSMEVILPDISHGVSALGHQKWLDRDTLYMGIPVDVYLDSLGKKRLKDIYITFMATELEALELYEEVEHEINLIGVFSI